MPNSEIVCQGWLTKSPPSKGIFRPRWRKRWFVLREGTFPHQYLLEYYTDDSGKRLKGGINLDECEQLIGPLSVTERHKHTFQIHTPGRTYFLAADSESEMSKWLSSLCQVCSLKSVDEETSGRIVYARAGDENKPSSRSGGVHVPEETRKNGRTVKSRDELSESDDSSPTLSNKLPSGPYIPISECFTGKPLPKSETYPILGGGDVTYSNSSVFQFPPKVNWATHPSKREHTDSDATLTPTPTSPDAARSGGRAVGGVVAPPRPPKPKKNGSPSLAVEERSSLEPEASPRSPHDQEESVDGASSSSASTCVSVQVQVSPPNSAGALYCNISDLTSNANPNTASIRGGASSNTNSPTSPAVAESQSGPAPPPVVDRNLKPPPPDARPFHSPTIITGGTNGSSPTGRPSYASGTMTLPSRGQYSSQSGGVGSSRHFGFGGFFAGPIIDRSRKPPEGREGVGGYQQQQQSQSHHAHLSLGPTPAQIKSSGHPGVHHGRSMSSSSTQQYNQRTLPCSSSSSPRRAGPVLSPNEKRPFIYHEYEQAEEMKGTYLQIQCQPVANKETPLNSQSHPNKGDSPKFPSNPAIVQNKGRGLGGERMLRKGGGGGPLLHPIDPNSSVEYRLIDPVKTKALNRTIEDREKQLRNNTLSKNHH